MLKALSTLLVVMILGCLSLSVAQTPTSYTLTNDMAEYTQVHVIEVNDVPGHIYRIYELVWDQAENDNPPIFNGVKVERIVQVGFADYVGATGSFNGFEQYHLESGELLYGNYRGTTQTVAAEDGTNSTTVAAVHNITGGSGTFQGFRGLLRSSLGARPSEGDTFTWSGVIVEGSYWMIDDMTETSE